MNVVVQNPQKRDVYGYEKKTYVVTLRCAAAAVVSAVVLRRPTKEYTHPYSMMHRRLPTAGNEVAPHYHQLLVPEVREGRVSTGYQGTSCVCYVLISRMSGYSWITCTKRKLRNEATTSLRI